MAELSAGARALLWALRNGWEPDAWASGWRGPRHRVIWAPEEPEWIAIRTWPNGGPRFTRDLGRVRVASAQQAVDVLCALGVLPPHLSSLHRDGHDAGKAEGYGEGLARGW